MRNPFISVIIPALNEEKYIENTLKAIKNQRYNGKYEIIVADGLSEDKTVNVARKYTKNIVIVKKKGIGAGRNAGALLAKGDILLFVDADTIPSSNLLTTISRVFKDKTVVGATCKLYPIKANKSVTAVYKFYNKFMKFSIKLKKASIAGMCCAYRKSVFKHLKGFNEKLSTFEDVDFSLRANRLGNIVILKNAFALTSGRRIEKWGAANAVISYLYNFFKFYLTGKGYTAGQYKAVR